MSIPRRRSFLATCLCLIALPAIAGSQEAQPPPTLLGLPRAEFQARRAEFMKHIKSAENRGRSGPEDSLVIVVRGEDDKELAEGRFRQGNGFAYLTGVDVPGSWLVLLPNEGRATLYLPPAGIGGDRLEASRPAPGPESAGRFGFDRVEPTSKLLGDLFSAISDPMASGRSSRRTVYLASPNLNASATSADARFARFLKEGAPGTSFKDMAPILGELRKAKSPAEIDMLKRAIAITGDAQAEVIRNIRPGLFEYQLEGKIQGGFISGGALRNGFPSIVGSGPNSTIPHYFANNRKIEDGDLVVVDIGAEFDYYTADITRTYPASGKFTPRQREIYQLVLDAQADAARRMKPGETRLMMMTGVVSRFLRESPLRAKGEDGREYTMDHFFIHGLGHYLGMDVHDVGDYAKPLQVGEVFTIEPGIYIKSENLGVRIEDDYLMTPAGPEKLSKDIPSEPDDIERRIAEARGSRAEVAHP